MSRGDPVTYAGEEPLDELPRVDVEVAENGGSVPWPISFGLLDGFQVMTGWHEDQSNEKGVRNAIRIFKHDRLKLRLVEIDANSLGNLAVEAGIAARSFAKNVNRLRRPECRSAGTASFAHVCSLMNILFALIGVTAFPDQPRQGTPRLRD